MQTVLSPEQCKGLNCFDACLINHVNSRYHEYACAFSNGYYFVFHPQINNNQTHIGLSLHQSKKISFIINVTNIMVHMLKRQKTIPLWKR